MFNFMVNLHNRLIGGLRREEGQGLVEYSLIIVLVSIACIVALGLLGTKISGVFTLIEGKL
jgi:pilus assembly protein Flp/PilA